MTYPLIVDNCHFFNPPEATEFFIQVTLLGSDAQAKHTQHRGWVRRLLCQMSSRKLGAKETNVQWEHAKAAWGVAICVGKEGS